MRLYMERNHKMRKQPYWTDNRKLTLNEVRQGLVENWLNGCEFSEMFLNSDLHKMEIYKNAE
jgi:hypothetical protein